ncbi:hypothetical protein [Levilactobacillus brevis]|uniref:MucBP domain-containing protein n=1 Tax=Levilactobacillus brevis TaxID=1580 RepID=A0AA41ER72_LEVBR|nr:hypothetical protein [Levilactobacillus brevis]KID44512.1 hypothetical protein LbDm2_0614 [Levilactobacillus brevis]MBS0948230.1 hypothetical protein [Levilactobacillus brevis]MBS0977098.1 hypothetical protein [Levilactobacillus brevis]MBS1011381.1 hypothetical protein [Levilactobacillus brevis]MCU0199312.1 hypothetical protein [Levilactobacillus brevis]
MKKLTHRYAAALMLLGAVAGIGLTAGKTTAHASITPIVTPAQTAKNQKKLDTLFDKIDISKAFGVTDDYGSGTAATVKPDTYNYRQTYKLTKATALTNEFRHKTVTLPKGSVVTGYTDGQGNLTNLDNTTLSIKNQKKIFSKLGNWKYSFLMSKTNGAAVKPYTRSTAFSYKSLASVTALPVKNNKAPHNGDERTRPFITVTADSQLIYHSKGKVYKATRYAKIKSFKRTHSTLTYYLSKPVSGVTTKKTKVGKAYQYKMTLKLGQVYQNSMIYSDPGEFNLSVKNGKQTFFLTFGEIAEDYVNSVTGYETVPTRYSKMATDYIQGLY